jgi:hypothetical protein
MRSIQSTLAVLVSAACAAGVQAAILSGPITNPANGNSYYLLTRSTWLVAEAEAVTLGGHLATINNAAENTWVYNTFSNFAGVNRNLWIGLRDLNEAVNSSNRATRRLEFGWITGEPVTYTRWSEVEPNNPISNDPANPEFYGHIWSPTDPNRGEWNNARNVDALFGIGIHGVVEVSTPIPEPTAVGLMAGLAALCLRRLRA